MEVEIISKEYIKPSSSTPNHLKTHKLSFLDLSYVHSYIPLVLYYPAEQDTNHSQSDIISDRLQLLKQSLSETLSRFYPFAGKIKDPYSIDCSDNGVYFAEAKVKISLNTFLNNHPNFSLINKFLPDDVNYWTSTRSNHIAGVQVTTFACGGTAVGVYVSHIIADGTAFSSFLRSWAITAHKNLEESICPKFDTSSFFPHNDAYPREVFTLPFTTSLTKLGRYITTRYVFEASAIAKLKATATSSRVRNPTRVEVVTALFGKCIMASLKARSGSADKPFLMNHAVNLRRRAMPQFSEYNMGNFAWITPVLCKDKEEVLELEALVWEMKETLAKLNGDFVNRLQGDEGIVNYLEAINYEREIFYANPVDLFYITSWCNFGLYDIDFGWGKPAWVSMIDLAEMYGSTGGLILMDTSERDGIEVWAFLLEEDVATLKSDEEFLTFATVNPSPLK